jgi:hypothetical protein
MRRSLAPIEDIVDILQIVKKENIMNILENFAIYSDKKL